MGETIRQTFNLYNTVGLIDKDKNIYFVPHQADIYAKVTASRTKVCDCYYELFNTVSPFSSKYQNTEISQWSPEDRRLVIEGTIDDFRQSRGQGLALNYLIINRAIYEVEGETETLISNYYYAMFIDSVEQVGSRSVKLNVTPDYFTNFYYLNNNDTLTSTYDPFNPVMKNCFIERQHYDRFDITTNNAYCYKNLRKILGSEETFKYKYQYKKDRLFLPIGVTTTLSDYKSFCSSLKNISTKEQFVTFVSNMSEIQKKWFIQLFVSYFNIIFKESVLLPTSLSVPNSLSYELHYYKCGYSSYKGVTLPFTHTAVPFICIPNGFSNIYRNWFSSISIYHYYSDPTKLSLVTRFEGTDVYDTDRVMDYISSVGLNPYVLTTFISKYSPINDNIYNISSYNYGVSIDYKFGLAQNNEININQELWENVTSESILNGNKVVTMNKNTYALPPFNYIKKQENSNIANLVGDITAGLWFKKYQSGIYTSSLFTVGSDGYVFITPVGEGMWYSTESWLDEHGFVPTSIGYTQPEIKWNCLLFVVAEHNTFDSQLFLKDQNTIALNKYIDPLLETEPYCFYSISINETEQILSKVKMIESYVDTTNLFSVKLLPIMSYNDAYKVGLIPSYYINSNWNRYYTEAIVTVISSQVPIIEDSWLGYYQTNKAQMKNQYAVQSSQFSEGYTQSISQMPFDMITGGVNKGIRGVVSGAIGGFGKLTNNIVSNFYQVERIGLAQRAKLSDMGAKPDTVKLAGSDVLYEIIQNERGFYLNYYRIDEVSYNSACKYLERFGYLVNIFDSINVFDRIGLNYVKITSFDFVEDDFVLSQEQMEAISKIFEEGVTLLHNHDYLHNLGEVIDNVSYHNYELSLV